MASITIKYTAPEAPVAGQVAPICSLMLPNGSYVDLDVYDGTVWDTNVYGIGDWEGLVEYLGKISHTPNILIMFKAAARDGEVTFEEEDYKMVEYLKELGAALAEFGFTVDAGDGASEEGGEGKDGGEDEPIEP